LYYHGINNRHAVTTQLFKKLAYFTDIHWGRSNNNPVALEDNEKFVDWFVAEALKRGCETFIFGGDWHDNRHQIGLQTLDYSFRALQKINDSFKQSFFIPGNHDLFFRASRKISSVVLAEQFPKIRVMNDIETVEGVTFLPWLVGDEIKTLKGITGKYVFAHLEVPGFNMNAKVPMPDSAHAVNAEQFTGPDAVYTGHFHMRQQKGNIVYTGNVMPFSFSDNWDAERGAMFLDWGAKHEFVAWPKQPLFRTMLLSDMLNNPEKMLCANLTARVTIDVEISFEEAQIIKDEMMSAYDLRKVELIPQTTEVEQTIGADVKFQSIDQIMSEGLLSIKSDTLKPSTLLEIYQSLA
jgi:DNA repair exonuclease SbcCD nuclease subunit